MNGPAFRLANRAAQLLYEEDPELVEGGCSDVSEILAALLRRRGFDDVRVVYGWARKPPRGKPFMHAWLELEGLISDFTLIVQDKNPLDYQYREDPSVEGALLCPDEEGLGAYVEGLDRRLESRGDLAGRGKGR